MKKMVLCFDLMLLAAACAAASFALWCHL